MEVVGEGRAAGLAACLVALGAIGCAGGSRPAPAPEPAATFVPGGILSEPVTTVVPDSAAEARERSERDSLEAAALLVKGMDEYRGHDYPAATVDFNAALRLRPRLAEAVAGLAGIAGDERRYAAALTLADSAVALGDTATWLAAARGRSLANLGRCPESVEILAPLLRGHPERRSPASELARCLIELDRAKEAVAVMQVAVRGEPLAYPLRYALVDAFIATRQLDSALVHARYLTEHYPQNGLWWVLLGRVLVLRNRMEEARASFERGFRERPGLVDSLAPIDRSAWQAVQGLPSRQGK